MSRASIDDPGYWRNRVEESRAMAEQLHDLDARAVMLKVADSYHHLAKAAERRAAETAQASTR